jgi:hypothetical protein
MNQHSSNQVDLEQPTVYTQIGLEDDDHISSELDDANRTFSEREDKCLWYALRLRAYPFSVLVFNLKGRENNRQVLNVKLASHQFVERLRLMLLEVGLVLVDSPTIDQVKPWIYIPIQVLKCPIDGTDFENMDTKIRNTMKDLLKPGIKSSDRIQLKNILPF